MRKFKCQDCEHTFEVQFGQGGRGRDMTCPECGSHAIYRDADEGWVAGPGRGFRFGGRRARRTGRGPFGFGWRRLEPKATAGPQQTRTA